jgi:hypothetical protein
MLMTGRSLLMKSLFLYIFKAPAAQANILRRV